MKDIFPKWSYANDLYVKETPTRYLKEFLFDDKFKKYHKGIKKELRFRKNNKGV
tara:strand:- start:1808 stop:1969 length:162 start_codon:yes stop_codon:yes gene_type:complete